MSFAVYTTVYPGVEPFLAAWSRSLRAQTDRDFELWIGVDALAVDQVRDRIGSDTGANWWIAPKNSTPAQIRQQALAEIVERCAAVALVDSDDVLHPSRVASAKADLAESDLAGCALRLIDCEGRDLGDTFTLSPDLTPDSVLPRNNVFGFSNSSFRSGLLRRCFPIPDEAVMVDWFLATRAWLLGARLAFDRAPRMDYRQYANNTARVRYPVSGEQVVSDTALVHRHFQLVLAAEHSDSIPARYRQLESASADVEEFHRQIILDAGRLEGYVQAINALSPPPLWWSCVAHPALRRMWSRR